jgi:uncharacterized Zn finger protein
MDCSCPDWEVPCEHHAFYLLAEAFDDDPFTILAWRGREREDLLSNLHAGRSDGPPAADHAEQTGPPLADRFDSYFVIQAELPTTSPALSSSTALLDQLPRGGAHCERAAVDRTAATRLHSTRRGSRQRTLRRSPWHAS